MNRYAMLSFFLLLSVSLCAQYADSIRYLDFKARAIKTPDQGYVPQNLPWRSEFVAGGQSGTLYAIDIVDDTTSYLSKSETDGWRRIDTIIHIGITMYGPDKLELPLYQLTDFNRDGFVDLVCQIETNMNGNRWTTIYLFHPQHGGLEKLRNTAEMDAWEIWDNPEYYPADSTIHCVREASLYGIYIESTYQLRDFKAWPLEKYVEDRTSARSISYRYYIGREGKWQQKKRRKKE